MLPLKPAAAPRKTLKFYHEMEQKIELLASEANTLNQKLAEDKRLVPKPHQLNIPKQIKALVEKINNTRAEFNNYYKLARGNLLDSLIGYGFIPADSPKIKSVQKNISKSYNALDNMFRQYVKTIERLLNKLTHLLEQNNLKAAKKSQLRNSAAASQAEKKDDEFENPASDASQSADQGSPEMTSNLIADAEETSTVPEAEWEIVKHKPDKKKLHEPAAVQRPNGPTPHRLSKPKRYGMFAKPQKSAAIANPIKPQGVHNSHITQIPQPVVNSVPIKPAPAIRDDQVVLDTVDNATVAVLKNINQLLLTIIMTVGEYKAAQAAKTEVVHYALMCKITALFATMGRLTKQIATIEQCYSNDFFVLARQCALGLNVEEVCAVFTNNHFSAMRNTFNSLIQNPVTRFALSHFIDLFYQQFINKERLSLKLQFSTDKYCTRLTESLKKLNSLVVKYAGDSYFEFMAIKMLAIQIAELALSFSETYPGREESLVANIHCFNANPTFIRRILTICKQIRDHAIEDGSLVSEAASFQVFKQDYDVLMTVFNELSNANYSGIFVNSINVSGPVRVDEEQMNAAWNNYYRKR